MSAVTQDPQSPEEFNAAAARLGEELGLDGPAPAMATQRAMKDPDFVRALKALRKFPELRDQMLAAPETARIRKPGDTLPPHEPQSDDAPPSAAQLAAKAAGAVLKWGMDGLQPAQPWVIERRLAACNACNFQVPAPDTLAYRGAKVLAGKDATICKVCHCLIKTKAAISTEACPEKDLDNPALSRWQEPWTPERPNRWLWDNDPEEK